MCIRDSSHTNHGESYLKFPLAVCRLSGAEDRVNVVASAALLERCPLTEGEELSVEGEVRSFNNRSGVGSRLVISVYARQMHREPGEEENRLRLTGTLCKVCLLYTSVGLHQLVEAPDQGAAASHHDAVGGDVGHQLGGRALQHLSLIHI